MRFANGQNLVKGNEIRSGGFRVGVVEDMKPVQLSAGQVGAELKLKLDKTIGKIPEDSRWRIRPRSALGLKYLELARATRRQALADGDTVPLEQTEANVDLDEVFKMFDAKTRAASQQNLRGFGDAFAGRGAAVGRTIEEAPRAASATSSRSTRNLADPDTAARRASSRSSATRRASSRRSRRPTRTCSRRWPTPGRRRRATPRRCASTSPRARRRWTRRSRRSASSARSSPT